MAWLVNHGVQGNKSGSMVLPDLQGWHSLAYPQDTTTPRRIQGCLFATARVVKGLLAGWLKQAVGACHLQLQQHTILDQYKQFTFRVYKSGLRLITAFSDSASMMTILQERTRNDCRPCAESTVNRSDMHRKARSWGLTGVMCGLAL